MYVLVILLFLVTCNLSTSIGSYNEDNNTYETDLQSGDFFQSIKNFFHNLKNQIHARLFGQGTMSVPAPLPAEVLQLDISELQERLGDREWHPLNLSTLFIDPNKDWGFRIDNWYFIRKESIDENGFHRNSDESNFQYPSTIQPKTSVKVETEETFDTTNDLGITESSSIASTLEMDNVTPLMTQESNSPTTIPTIEPIDSSENSSLVTNVSNFGNSANASDLFVEAP